MYVASHHPPKPRQALSVGESALRPLGPEPYVWVVSQSGGAPVVNKIKVEAGLRQQGRVEVLSGLTEGQQVVIEGALRLREGAAIKVQDKSVLAPKAASGKGGGGEPAGANRE